MRDDDLLREAIRRGYLEATQVDSILKVQKDASERGFTMPVSKILVMRGVLTSAQVDSITNGDRPKTVQQFGPYEIITKLGEGAMGTVYKAIRSEAPDKPVALKILNPSTVTDPEANQRFQREAQALVAMKHPNIVQGYESGEINGRLYVAMEFLDGKLLCDVLRERGALPEKEAIQIGLDIAQALEYMHGQGYVHRDVKPDNMVVTSDGHAKLTDLGLAKSTNNAAALTAAGKTFGTPAYMSPEHLSCEKTLDIRTDIYSLGAAIFHAVTGSLPFDASNPFEVIGMVLDKPTPDAHERRKEVSKNLAALLKTMMAKDRLQRHPTPTEVVADLERVGRGEPHQWKPGAPTAPARPTTRRMAIQGGAPQKQSAASKVLTVVGILVGLGLLVVAYWFLFK